MNYDFLYALVCSTETQLDELGRKFAYSCIAQAKKTNENIVAVCIDADCREWIGWQINSVCYILKDGTHVDIEDEEEHETWVCFFEENISFLMRLYGEDNWGCISIDDNIHGERSFGL